MLAVVNGDASAVHYLVALAYSGRSEHLLDIRDTQCGNTALHLAVAANRPSFVRPLVVAGASPCIRSRRGQTALLVACERGLVQCINALMRPVTDDDHATMNQFCSDVQLPARATPPTISLPDTNLLNCQGRLTNIIPRSHWHSLTLELCLQWYNGLISPRVQSCMTKRRNDRRSIKLANFCGRGIVARENRPIKSLNHAALPILSFATLYDIS